MKIENVSQKQQVPLQIILPKRLIEDFKKEEESENVKNTKEKFGVEKVTDIIDIELNVGAMVFSMYCVHNPLPDAPLAKQVALNRLDKLSEKLYENKEIEIDDKLKESIKKVMTEDLLWKQMTVEVSFIDKKDDKKSYMALGYGGLELFPKIKEALMGLFSEEDLVKLESEQDKKEKESKKK